MSTERSNEQSVVFVVDDDDAVRAAVGRLVRSIGLNVVLLASAREFLAHKLPSAPCCLVLDVRLPGLGGLDFQAELANDISTPIIFLTAYGDIPMSVKVKPNTTSNAPSAGPPLHPNRPPPNITQFTQHGG